MEYLVMERIKFRQHAERILDRAGHSDVDFSFEMERIMSPAVLTIYDKDSNNIAEIESPNKTKLLEKVEELKKQGKI